ncbi:hypothetical protein Tco_0675908 [Tanacetum coccineum]
MVINSPCLIDKKELAILGQMTTGKELSNPLMADSLPKTILLTNLVVPLTKVGDKAVHKELGDRMEMAVTTASSFEAEQDSERKEADDIDWSKIIEQAQERQSGSMIMYHALKKKLVTVAQASGSEPFQEQSTKEPKELSKEDLTEILEIVLVEETKAESCK